MVPAKFQSRCNVRGKSLFLGTCYVGLLQAAAESDNPWLPGQSQMTPSLRNKKCKAQMGVSENVVYPIVPNGFADHSPYDMAISLGILTQHFQVQSPNVRLIQALPAAGRIPLIAPVFQLRLHLLAVRQQLFLRSKRSSWDPRWPSVWSKKPWAMPSSHPCHPSLVSHFLYRNDGNIWKPMVRKGVFHILKPGKNSHPQPRKKNSKQLQLSELRFKVEDGWGIVSIIFSEGASQTTSSLIISDLWCTHLSTNPTKRSRKNKMFNLQTKSTSGTVFTMSLPCLYHEGSQHFLHKTQQPSCESRWSDQRGIPDLAWPQLQ